ncbi:S-protein homolog 29-like [Cicer arietinum]|uniref:S-protein homolog n=1 Tax=Cicer arietinum TaxID=3827 RepID=A0A1S3EHR9_CICAR|nr:S-protein homolog 29-like [Cicer arietinum]
MSLSFSKFLLPWVLILFLVHNVLGERVIVTNLLENNLDVTIHCKSADDDLGAHLLRHGESFSWHFGLTTFGTTRFYCAFHFDVAVANEATEITGIVVVAMHTLSQPKYPYGVKWSII